MYFFTTLTILISLLL